MSILYTYFENTPASDHTAGHGSIVTSGVAGENLAFPDVVYIDSSGEWSIADADADTSIGLLGMALATIASGEVGLILLQGFVRDDTWAWTDGGINGQIYVSGTAGDMTQTPPAGIGDQVQVVGYAHTADVIYFNPENTVIEVA